MERCFDLSRDIDFHVRSMASTGERAVAGRTTGLITIGESVTWEGTHLFVRQRFTAQVTMLERPLHFRDVMTAGAFSSFVHDHRFERAGDQTLMHDEVHFCSPYGLLGRMVDFFFMARYLKTLLTERGLAIKAEAERLLR